MNECDTHDVARRILSMGGRPVRVSRRGKKALESGWSRKVHDESSVIANFKNGENVGILLGEPGGWIVDIDVDSVKAIPIALQVLPPTFRYGRASKRSSHYLYRVTRPLDFGKLDRAVDSVDGDGGKGAHIELRSTGHQSVFPGSVHESGERYEVEADIPIADIEPHELLHAFDQVARRAGWVPESKPATAPATRSIVPRAKGFRYGAPAARAELARLASATKGARNPTLNLVTFRLWQLVEAGTLSSDVISEIRDIALSIGLGEKEVERTIQSATNSAKLKPRPVDPAPVEVKPKPQPVKGFVAELIDELEAGQGRALGGIPIPSFPHLTDATFGVRGYVLFTGPSGAGKTTMVNSIALNVAQGGDGHPSVPVVYVTAEMTPADVALSMLASMCRVPVRELLVGEKGAELIEGPAGRLRMTEPTYTRVRLAVNALTELERSQRLSIVSASQWMRAWERGEHALIGLEEQVRALHGERPVLVIIDTLATLEVQPMNENPRYESDLDMDADIVTALKRWKVALPTGSAILAVHEEGKAATGKGDGHSVRGSSKYLYSSDQRWTLVYADQLNGTRKKKKREREPSDDVTEVDLHLVKARRGGKANVVIALDHEHGKGAIREVGRFTVRELIGKDKPAETDDAPDELTNDAGPAFKSRRPKRKKVKA